MSYNTLVSKNTVIETKIENKISVTTGLITKIDLSTKITEIENKTPDFTDLIKRIDFDPKLNEISNRGTSNETKEIEPGKKLNGHITLYTKFVNKLERGISIVSSKDNTSPSCIFYFKD